mmetsp:Transcript_63264/g.176018  ORF Transcript_63264/g.176018 Transcript_63264/m.176018 type:complete len:322 (+) Transcript_63264:631-1596(+)
MLHRKMQWRGASHGTFPPGRDDGVHGGAEFHELLRSGMVSAFDGHVQGSAAVASPPVHGRVGLDEHVHDSGAREARRDVKRHSAGRTFLRRGPRRSRQKEPDHFLCAILRGRVQRSRLSVARIGPRARIQQRGHDHDRPEPRSTVESGDEGAAVDVGAIGGSGQLQPGLAPQQQDRHLPPVPLHRELERRRSRPRVRATCAASGTWQDAFVQEEPRDVKKAILGGIMERRLAPVWHHPQLPAAFQEHRGAARPPGEHGIVQGRQAPAACRVHERAAVEQRPQHRGVAIVSGRVHRRFAVGIPCGKLCERSRESSRGLSVAF